MPRCDEESGQGDCHWSIRIECFASERGALTCHPGIVSLKSDSQADIVCCVPVVQRLGHRPFTAVTRVRIPSGTPNTFNHLQDPAFKNVGSKRFNKDFRVPEVLFYAFSPCSGTSMIWRTTRSWADRLIVITACVYTSIVTLKLACRRVS
jgi:hypothetical protein